MLSDSLLFQFIYAIGLNPVTLHYKATGFRNTAKLLCTKVQNYSCVYKGSKAFYKENVIFELCYSEKDAMSAVTYDKKITNSKLY